MHFFQLHQQTQPLLLANVWDATSARAAEAAGYAALGTSSAAISDMLGYPDGEGLSFAELQNVVARLRAVTPLPLSVDMEAGYGDTPDAVVGNLLTLVNMGVVGVNLEDSVVRHGTRALLDAATFAERLGAIQAGLARAGSRLFVNVRTDTFLLGGEDALAQTISRGRLYAANGADGLFVPCVTRDADIAAIVAEVPLPVNVMCMPQLPAFARLAALGVKRISMGNFLHGRMQQALQRLFADVRNNNSFDTLFAHAGH